MKKQNISFIYLSPFQWNQQSNSTCCGPTTHPCTLSTWSHRVRDSHAPVFHSLLQVIWLILASFVDKYLFFAVWKWKCMKAMNKESPAVWRFISDLPHSFVNGRADRSLRDPVERIRRRTCTDIRTVLHYLMTCSIFCLMTETDRRKAGLTLAAVDSVAHCGHSRILTCSCMRASTRAVYINHKLHR